MGRGRKTLNNTSVGYNPDNLRPGRGRKVDVEFGPAVVERSSPSRPTPAERAAQSGESHRSAQQRRQDARDRVDTEEAIRESDMNDARERGERVMQSLDRVIGKAELAAARRRRNAAANRRNPGYSRD